MTGYDPKKPYNDLPLLPPQEKLETESILKKTISAGRALAELKGLGKSIPNQALLVDSVILQEAKASSEIENIITTNDALYKAFTAKLNSIDPATKEVLRYREALRHGYHFLKKHHHLTTNLFIKIVQIIKQNQAGIRSVPGTTIKDMVRNEIVYTPPEGETRIRNLLKNLENFIHQDDKIDPLIKLPVIHYQFEAIHPFLDGNGRTGRIINILYLVLNNLLELPVLFHSKAIIENKKDYYQLLNKVTMKNDWEPWIIYMLDVIEETARLTSQKILAIYRLMQETTERVQRVFSKRVNTKGLVEILFHQPYTKGQFLVNANIAERKTAAEYLKELEKKGILQSYKIGKEILYLNVGLYDLLSQ